MIKASYFLPNEFQCHVGEVIKAGSKYVWIRELNAWRPHVIRLSVRRNKVRWLLGDCNPFDKVKGVPRT